MTKREEIIAILAERQGVTVNEIADLVGLARSRAHGEIWRLAQIGVLFTLAAKPGIRLFSSQAELEAMRAQVDAETAAYLFRRKEEKLALRRIKESKRKRPSGRSKRSRKADDKKAQEFKRQEAINLASVQIQRIQTPLPRFHVPETFVGEFKRLGIGRYEA